MATGILAENSWERKSAEVCGILRQGNRSIQTRFSSNRRLRISKGDQTVYRSWKTSLLISIAGVFVAFSAAGAVFAADPGESVGHDGLRISFKVAETCVVDTKGMDIVDGSRMTSPNFRRVAFAIKKGEKQQAAVVDGVEGKTFDGDVFSFYFSPNSKRLDYEIYNAGKWQNVIDGVEGKVYDGIHYTAFSPNSKHVGYMALDGRSAVAVIDGVEQKKYKTGEKLIGAPLCIEYSPNSKHVAYLVPDIDKGKSLIVLDGVEMKGYDELSMEMEFSPDSTGFAYVAKEGGKWLVVVDRREGRSYDEIRQMTLSMSPDSKHVSYVARRGQKYMMVIDGVEGEHYDSVGRIYFSADSKRNAYVARSGGKAAAVIDGIKGKEYDSIAGFAFSPNSRHYAYAANRLGKGILIINGVETREFPEYGYSLAYSPNSKCLAYSIKQGDKYLNVIDGIDDKLYDEVRDVAFSPDSRHYAYWAKQDAKWLMIVDGVRAQEYDGTVSDLLFDSPNALHALAWSGSKIMLAKIQLRLVVE